jgi:hypothetical protein
LIGDFRLFRFFGGKLAAAPFGAFVTISARSGHSPVATNRRWVDASAGQMGAADLSGSRCFEAFRGWMIV